VNFGFKIVEVSLGKRASVYTIQIEGEEQTELDKFLAKKEVQNEKEALEFIAYRLQATIPNKGAQKRFFDENEGKATDAVCKLKQSLLRCYCLRFGKLMIIAGSGGIKPRNIRRRQDKDDLDKAVKILQYVEKRIEEAQKLDQFEFSYNDGRITKDSKIKFEANE
jgi:hypothetical protein